MKEYVQYRIEFLYKGKWNRSCEVFSTLNMARCKEEEVLKNYAGFRVVEQTIKEEVIED